MVDQCPPDDPDTIVNKVCRQFGGLPGTQPSVSLSPSLPPLPQGCLLFAEGKYEEAVDKFIEAMNLGGYKADLSYNIALCFYRQRDYAQALKVGWGWTIRNVGNKRDLTQATYSTSPTLSSAASTTTPS